MTIAAMLLSSAAPPSGLLAGLPLGLPSGGGVPGAGHFAGMLALEGEVMRSAGAVAVPVEPVAGAPKALIAVPAPPGSDAPPIAPAMASAAAAAIPDQLAEALVGPRGGRRSTVAKSVPSPSAIAGAPAASKLRSPAMTSVVAPVSRRIEDEEVPVGPGSVGLPLPLLAAAVVEAALPVTRQSRSPRSPDIAPGAAMAGVDVAAPVAAESKASPRRVSDASLPAVSMPAVHVPAMPPVPMPAMPMPAGADWAQAVDTALRPGAKPQPTLVSWIMNGMPAPSTQVIGQAPTLAAPLPETGADTVASVGAPLARNPDAPDDGQPAAPQDAGKPGLPFAAMPDRPFTGIPGANAVGGEAVANDRPSRLARIIGQGHLAAPPVWHHGADERPGDFEDEASFIPSPRFALAVLDSIAGAVAARDAMRTPQPVNGVEMEMRAAGVPAIATDAVPALPVSAPLSGGAPDERPGGVSATVPAGVDRIEVPGAETAGAIGAAAARPGTMSLSPPERAASEAMPRPGAVRSDDFQAPPALTSERFGDVRIAMEGGARDLRVTLALGSGAGLVMADGPRLAADLAASGIRLESFEARDVGGGATAAPGLGTGSGTPGGNPAPGGEGRPRPSQAVASGNGVSSDASMLPQGRVRIASDRYA